MARITDFIYASQWTVRTEEVVKGLTLAQLRDFIRENSEVEEDEDEEGHLYINGHNLYGKTYMLTGEKYGRDEFFISNDGRVFYLISINRRVEIVEEIKMQTEQEREKTRKIARELDTRLVNNHMETTITMKRSGNEYSIVKLSGHNGVMVFTDKGTNESGETIWTTKIGVFKDTYKLARYIEQIH